MDGTTVQPYRTSRGVLDPAGFNECDEALLELARSRYENEQRSNATLQAKTALFLAFAGFFSALLTQPILKLVDNWRNGILEGGTAVALSIAFGLVLRAIYRLLQSAISDKYSDLAKIQQWRAYASDVRGALDDRWPSDRDTLCRDKLKADLLDAFAEAADRDFTANQEKAARLADTARILQHVVIWSVVGVILFTVQATVPRSQKKIAIEGEVTIVPREDQNPANTQASPAPTPSTGGSASPVPTQITGTPLPVRPSNLTSNRSETGVGRRLPVRPANILRR